PVELPIVAPRAGMRVRLPAPQGLRRLRLKAGLARQELAETIGVAVATLRDWEYGRSLPRREALTALSGCCACHRKSFASKCGLFTRGRGRGDQNHHDRGRWHLG